MAALPVLLADDVRAAAAGEVGNFRLVGGCPLVDGVFSELAAATVPVDEVAEILILVEERLRDVIDLVETGSPNLITTQTTVAKAN